MNLNPKISARKINNSRAISSRFRILFGTMLRLTLLVAMCFELSLAQTNTVQNPHEIHQKTFHQPSFQHEAQYDSTHQILHSPVDSSTKGCLLKKQVYGWHPAWRGTAYKSYDFNLLSTVAYFSYQVDPETGNYKSINQWRSTGIVEMAHERGASVELTASNFGASGNRKLLGNTKSVQTLVDSLVALVLEKDADGICIDFEGLPVDQKDNFTAFISKLSDKLHATIRNSMLTLVLYAVDWHKVFDIPKLNLKVDRFVVMAYDYHWAGAPTAGPVAPLAASKLWGNFGDTPSVDSYLERGVPETKMLLGVPYYGYHWQTESTDLHSKTKASGKAVLFSQFPADFSKQTLIWDSASSTPYAAWEEEGVAQQLWMDNEKSLGNKYGIVNSKNLAGIGIWALGYDHGQEGFWKLIKKTFADCSTRDIPINLTGRTPGLEGETSAERNTWNWVWILVGMVGTVLIITLVKRL